MYSCYDYDQDTEAICTSIPEVEEWLSTREDMAKEPSPTLLELARADDWRVLKPPQGPSSRTAGQLV